MRQQKKIIRKGLLIPSIILSALTVVMFLDEEIYTDSSMLVATLFVFALPAALLWFLTFKLRMPDPNYIPMSDYIPFSQPAQPARQPYTPPVSQQPYTPPDGYAYAPAAAPEPPALGEIDTVRFRTDPAYRDRMTRKVQKQADSAYAKRIKDAEKQLDIAVRRREQELTRCAEARWAVLGSVGVNETEGLVRINGNIYPFTAVRSARINCLYGSRYVTTQQGRSRSHGHSTMTGGGLGVHVGRVTVGTGRGHGQSVTNTKSRSVTQINTIPTCDHLGIEVDLDGFVNEILILTGSVDQDSRQFAQAMNLANTLIGVLQKMSRAPMPANVLPVEQEPSVLALDREVTAANHALQTARSAVPSYELPQ